MKPFEVVAADHHEVIAERRPQQIGDRSSLRKPELDLRAAEVGGVAGTPYCWGAGSTNVPVAVTGFP